MEKSVNIKNRPLKGFTPAQKIFIQEQYRILSVKELARTLRVDKDSIRFALQDLGLDKERFAHAAETPLKFHLLAGFLLFVSIMLSYGHTLNYAFHFDDLETFIENPILHVRNLSWDTLLPIFHLNRPLANLTYALNFYFDRLEPRGYHFLNILVHFANALLIYFIFLETLSLSGIGNIFSTEGGHGKERVLIALSGALLWAVHPIQTQAVTYVVQRMASLAAFFYLFSVLAYIQGRLSRGKGSLTWFVLSAVSALFAFGTKENTLTLPLIILLYDLFLINRFKVHFSRDQTLMILALLGILSVGFAWILHLYEGPSGLAGLLSAQYGKEEMDSSLRMMTEWRVMILYMTLLLLPLPARMNLDYDFPFSKSLFDPFTTFLSLLAILSLLVFSILKAKKYPLISFSILWFFINLAIESTFIKLDLVFEHRLYLSSVMFFLLFVNGVYLLGARFQARRMESFIGRMALLTIVLVILTHERNKVWATEISLWTDVASKSPNKFRVANNLSKAYMETEQWDKAKEKTAEAIRLNPKSPGAYHNRGAIKDHGEDYDGAIADYSQAIVLDPKNVVSYYNRGLAKYHKADYDGAIADYSQAIALGPKNLGVYNNLGLAKYHKADYDGAIAEYNQAVAVDPDYALSYYNRGLAKEHKGDHDRAIADYSQAIALDPKNVLSYYNRGLAREHKVDDTGAIADYTQAIALDPKNPIAYNNRGLTKGRKGDYEGAIADYSQAIALDPRYVLAYYNRGIEKYYKKDYVGAIADYNQAIALDPKNPLVYNNRGLAKGHKGNHDGAIADYNQAIALDPDHVSAYYNRGSEKAHKGDYGGAIADYNKVASLDSKNPMVYKNRGLMKERKGDHNGAIADYNQAVALDHEQGKGLR